MKKIISLFCLVLAFANNSCTDMDDNLEVARLQDVIIKDSEMYNLIERVTTDSDNPLEDIVCIDFVYPLEVKLYNADLVRTDSVILLGDDEFSAFLGSLTPSQALSISYPIITTFSDGDTFTINNNDELKVVIDQCSREDLVSYCNSVFSSNDGISDCVWKVQYLSEKDNKYVGGTFLVNPDNTLVFHYDGEDYDGNWIFLFVNDEFHININLEGTSQVAADWNIDRKMIFTGTTIEIVNSPESTMLVRTCQETDAYEPGDAGPAGGIVFYDKGEYSHGWRYMEAAPQDLDAFEWGCASALIGNSNAAIGSGLVNSAKIVNYHDNLTNYYLNPAVCNAANNGTVAAQKAITLTAGGQIDWFLPSEDELILMYENLYLEGLGNFTPQPYWSATEIDAQNAQTIDFATGNATSSLKIPTIPVKTRAVRYF